jgi:hypothetical protein
MKSWQTVLVVPLLWGAIAPTEAKAAERVESETASFAATTEPAEPKLAPEIVLDAATLGINAANPVANVEPSEPSLAPETVIAAEPVTTVEASPVDTTPTPTETPTKDPEPAQSTPFAVDPLPMTAEELAQYELLVAGDRAWLAEDIATAVSLYQEAKPPFAQEADYAAPNPAIYDPAALSPAGAVYWRYFQEGVAANLVSKIHGPMELLLAESPEFIPAYIGYGDYLRSRERYEEAAAILAQGAMRYPDEPELVAATVAAHNEAEQWLEASLAARQFVLFNPEHPEAERFELMADESFDHYRGKLKPRVTNNIIGGILTGLASFALTGNLWGPLSTAQTTILLLQGENTIGERITRQVLEAAPMLEDEVVLSYVNEIGQSLAAVSGRDEFNYEFHVILDENLNAFALPGGKIFINAGAIIETNSEAEFAGLLAHEISHASLSHGFQLISQGQLTANVVGNLPFGGLATNLLVFGYIRAMERQADRLGTRILASSGYAADGVRNLMVTLAEQNNPSPPAWLSTHPDTRDRVNYLETFILDHQLPRYAFEGIERHASIRERVARLLAEYQKTRPSWRGERQGESLQFQFP